MGKPFPGPWTYKFHPWTRAMSDSKSEANCSQKGAQLSVTEALLNITLFTIDVKRINCLYVLPSFRPDVLDFSSSRFDAALKMSPALRDLFSDVKNTGHKMSGHVSLYLRSSRSRGGAALKSIPASFLAFDELDAMDKEAIDLGIERQSGQLEKLCWFISTPTIPNFGINQLYNSSTQEHYYFPCPHCSRLIDLNMENLVVLGENDTDPAVHDSYMKCHKCGGRLEHSQKPIFLAKGIWEPTFANRNMRGFYINQLYSSTVTPGEFALKVHQAKTSALAEQQLYNSKLGLPTVTNGARVTSSQIADSIRRSTHGRNQGPAPMLTTIGIDVGKVFHAEVCGWRFPRKKIDNFLNASAEAVVIWEGTLYTKAEIIALIQKHRPHMVVQDANPDRRLGEDLYRQFPSLFRMCIFNESDDPSFLKRADQSIVSVNRTFWLDTALQRFQNQSIILPLDVEEEYKAHIQVPTRVMSQDRNGSPIARYVSNSADHFAFARCYAEIGLGLLGQSGPNYDIKSI
jgi:hypothetical protein